MWKNKDFCNESAYFTSYLLAIQELKEVSAAPRSLPACLSHLREPLDMNGKKEKGLIRYLVKLQVTLGVLPLLTGLTDLPC